MAVEDFYTIAGVSAWIVSVLVFFGAYLFFSHREHARTAFSLTLGIFFLRYGANLLLTAHHKWVPDLVSRPQSIAFTAAVLAFSSILFFGQLIYERYIDPARN
jgi:amino acid permease